MERRFNEPPGESSRGKLFGAHVVGQRLLGGDPDPKARGLQETPHGGADRAQWRRRRRPRLRPPSGWGTHDGSRARPAKTLISARISLLHNAYRKFREVVAGGAPLQRRVMSRTKTRDWSRAPPAKRNPFCKAAMANSRKSSTHEKANDHGPRGYFCIVLTGNSAKSARRSSGAVLLLDQTMTCDWGARAPSEDVISGR